MGWLPQTRCPQFEQKRTPCLSGAPHWVQKRAPVWAGRPVARFCGACAGRLCVARGAAALGPLATGRGACGDACSTGRTA